MIVNEVRAFALAGTGVTLTAFWQDSDILAKVVSILVSTAALSSSNPLCYNTLEMEPVAGLEPATHALRKQWYD